MIYVISDLHGYPFERFTALLKEVDFSENDFLYVLGDVVDRGKELQKPAAPRVSVRIFETAPRSC